MIRKITTAIAFNTRGAAIITIGARLPGRTAAIAVCSLGMGISGTGITLMLILNEKEIGESRQESLKWALEAQKHLQEKRDLVLQVEEIKTIFDQAEDKYAIAISFLEDRKEWIEKNAEAELN